MGSLWSSNDWKTHFFCDMRPLRSFFKRYRTQIFKGHVAKNDFFKTTKVLQNKWQTAEIFFIAALSAAFDLWRLRAPLKSTTNITA
jgi:hypothetical protein